MVGKCFHNKYGYSCCLVGLTDKSSSKPDSAKAISETAKMADASKMADPSEPDSSISETSISESSKTDSSNSDLADSDWDVGLETLNMADSTKTDPGVGGNGEKKNDSLLRIKHKI